MDSSREMALPQLVISEGKSLVSIVSLQGQHGVHYNRKVVVEKLPD